MFQIKQALKRIFFAIPNFFKRNNILPGWFLHIIQHVAGITGLVCLLVFSHIRWETWTFSGIYGLLTMLCITLGYHRLWTHRSFKLARPIEVFFILLSCADMEGSILEWVSVHRRHHQFGDTEKDPHNINQGFWYAHFTWFRKTNSLKVIDNVKDLQRDPWIMFQHRHYNLLAFLFAWVIPTLVCALWGQALAGFIVGGLFRLVVIHHNTWAINSFCHYWGTQPYTTSDDSKNNFMWGILSLGEGYHNFHHAFPYDYRNGVRWYEFDFTKITIRSLKFLGLAKDLKQASKEKIAMARETIRQRHVVISKNTQLSPEI